MSTYHPQPRDTSGVQLSEDILKLTELLAEHNHEIWAQQRISEGWTFGPQRDDAKKKHPGLVPYGKLTDSERQYDRNTALEALKVIIACGSRIVPLATGGVAENVLSQRERARADLAELLARLCAVLGTKEELSELLKTWSTRNDDDLMWQLSPELHRHLSRRLLKLGAALLAKEVVRTALGYEITVDQEKQHPWAKDVELRQIQ
ncbi:MAG: hypothetical protein IAG10_20295, partial [Planctomycetaceae bacterium]|nr:hypothetical protein [Planctomycetaceae bacterium]